MQQPSQSNAENDYRNPLDTFTDREEILALFEQTLRSAQSGRLHLLAVKGNSGTGKTFLVSYLAERVCPRFQWLSGQMSFAQSAPDFRTILLGLEEALKGGIPSARLAHYRAARDEYNRRFDEYKISIGSIQQHMVAGEQSSIANSPQSIQINAQLHERELHLRSELTRALVELAEESTHPLCLFIDGYERLLEGDPELDGWLWEKVLLDLAKASPQPLLVVTCGWEQPNNAAIKPFSHPTELDDFNLARVRVYLEKQDVITSTGEAAPPGQEELVKAFYELTKGHPLVLSLAVTYFKQLDNHQRTAQSLRVNRPLVDEQARVEFLEDRLLKRLPEPYRTLLERGPILRYFDQAALQALLSAESGDGAATAVNKLDDRTYDRFLRYPFINQGSVSGNAPAPTQPTFHDLVQRVRLEALRRHHSETKEHLHRTMADYYRRKVEAERGGKVVSKDAQWLAKVSEHEFRAEVEYLYHSLQVRTQQAETFGEWMMLIEQTESERNWSAQQTRSLLILMRQLVEEGEPFLSKTGEPYGHYLHSYGRFLGQEAHWQQAQTALEEAAKIFEQMGNQADFSTVLNNLASLYNALGKFEQAEQLMKRALAIQEQQLGPQHPDTAGTLTNLARLYENQGKYEQTESLLQRALAIREQQLGPQHYDTASSLSDLARLYVDQGKYEQAEPLLQRALAIWEQQLGPQHPDTASALHNLALLYAHQRKYEQAESLYQFALAICQQQLGPQHPDTAGTLTNLALLYAHQRKYEQAEPLLQRALAIREQQLGPQHHGMASSLGHLARLYMDQGKYEQAEPLYRRALDNCQQQLGPQHPNTASSLSYLARLYEAQRKYEQAEPLLQRALAIFEQQLGPQHPITATSLNNLAELYYAQGKYEQAEPLLQRALAIFVRQFGPEHPTTQMVYADYVTLLRKMERNTIRKMERNAKRSGWKGLLDLFFQGKESSRNRP